MEEEYLKFYYRIPLAGTCIASLLSYQAEYYTEEYSIMYGFGGLELMTYNYNDAEWADFIAESNGAISYE
jgi:oligopeptide transport system substrate-binding protein